MSVAGRGGAGIQDDRTSCALASWAFPNDTAIDRLLGAVLIEQDELEGRCMFSAESMAEIPALEDLLAQACLLEATA